MGQKVGQEVGQEVGPEQRFVNALEHHKSLGGMALSREKEETVNLQHSNQDTSPLNQDTSTHGN